MKLQKYEPRGELAGEVKALRAQLQQEREMADRLAEALDLWVKATEARRTETLPFGATPLSHPDLFNRHLTAAREVNTAMAQALDAYRALREGQRDA